MAYEYSMYGGELSLHKAGCRWGIEFNGHRRARWISADDAVKAAARHRTGLAEWDRTKLIVSDDLLRWRPIGESL
jgi:hypothetical protein